MQPKDAGCLWDMLQAAKSIARFVESVSLADFEADERTRAAVERKAEIIGEAARRLSDEFRNAHPEFDWKGIIGLRTILAHNYDAINPGQLYRIATGDVPALIPLLAALCPAEL